MLGGRFVALVAAALCALAVALPARRFSCGTIGRSARRGAVETIRWSPPGSYRRHTVRLCLVARDPAGNVSPPGCVPLRLP